MLSIRGGKAPNPDMPDTESLQLPSPMDTLELIPRIRRIRGGYLAQPGAGHINDPNYNPGHNNSLGHQLKDAVNPGIAPAYGAPGAVPGYGYQGAPVGANHVNNPYVNPGHNGSVQHQMNDAVNGNQVFPGQMPVSNYGQQGHGNGHGHSHGHDDADGHSH